jgi:hypothetical protein
MFGFVIRMVPVRTIQGAHLCLLLRAEQRRKNKINEMLRRQKAYKKTAALARDGQGCEALTTGFLVATA